MSTEKVKEKFLLNLFSKVLENPDKYPDQSIVLWVKSSYMHKWWFKTFEGTIDYAEKQDVQHNDVYITVNPLPYNASKKKDIKCVVTFHLDLDYGDEHEKESFYKTKEEAFEAINEFPIPPTMIVHSGNGFHCYWVLEEPFKITNNDDIKIIEDINRVLITQLGGDKGTQNINRILRLPGTHNYKNHDDIKEVTLEKDDGPFYNIEDFDVLESTTESEDTTDPFDDDDSDSYEDIQPNFSSSEDDIKIEDLNISSNIKTLIYNGNSGQYPSRSEADFAVTLSLICNGLDFDDVKWVFDNFKIGEKYRNEPNPSRYLKITYKNAKRQYRDAKSKGLSTKDMNDPLIVCGAVQRDKNNEKYLDPFLFLKYARECLHLKYLANNKTYFIYKNNRFQNIEKGNLCIYLNDILAKNNHEKLLTDPILKSILRYIKNRGVIHIDNRVDYVAFKNCLLNLNTGKSEPFNPKIFCQMHLPYNYDESSTCNRWLEFLNEIFPGDDEKIALVQELVGYIFRFDMPVPSMNLLIGDGANGKSVFIDTISSLIDESLVSNIGFQKLRNDRYLSGLVGKALNVTFENEVTYDNKLDISGTIKSVVSGEPILANPKYKTPFRFKPFAKHFFAMNNAPKILDKSFGMWRRIKIIDFPVRFKPKDQDVNLSERLKQELPGIFNWAYLGYKRLKANNFRFSECQTVKENMTIYGKYIKPRTVDQFIRLFLVEKTIRVRNGEISLKDLYDELLSFASKQKFKIERGKGKNYFKAYLDSRNFEIKNGAGNVVCIYGISLKIDIAS